MIEVNVFILTLILLAVFLLGYWLSGYLKKRYPNEQLEWHREVREFGEEKTAILKREYEALKTKMRAQWNEIANRS